MYFTFDDGPDGLNDPRLLKILRKQKVPATFFLLGRSVASDPASVGRLVLAGHAVGNHTWDHTDLSALPLAAVEHEMSSAQRQLGPLAGRCVRPPYGAMSPNVTTAARSLGLQIVLWSVDPEDWAHQNTPYIVNHILTHVSDRATVLMHDGGGNRSATVSAVKRLIPLLRARGYVFRTVPACRVPVTGTGIGLAKPKPAPNPTPTPTVTPTASPTPTTVVVP